MYAVPARWAVTTPSDVTVATDVLLLFQVTACVAVAGSMTGVSVSCWLFSMEMSPVTPSKAMLSGILLSTTVSVMVCFT